MSRRARRRPADAGSIGEAVVGPLAPADTRALRREVLRPRETVAQQAAHEPPGARAVGAWVGGELVAVGLIGPEARPAVGLVGPEEDPAVGRGGPEMGPDAGRRDPRGQASSWRVRGMATAPAHRGRGLGSAVLAELLAIARAGGAASVWCTARLSARTLYERAGFRACSRVYEIPGIGPHVLMELRL